MDSSESQPIKTVPITNFFKPKSKIKSEVSLVVDTDDKGNINDKGNRDLELCKLDTVHIDPENHHNDNSTPKLDDVLSYTLESTPNEFVHCNDDVDAVGKETTSNLTNNENNKLSINNSLDYNKLPETKCDLKKAHTRIIDDDEDDIIIKKRIIKLDQYIPSTTTNLFDDEDSNISSNNDTTPLEVTTTVGLADSSSNYIPVNGKATPGDRGGDGGNEDWTSSGGGTPAAHLREAEGEVSREADGRNVTSSGEAPRLVEDKDMTSDVVSDDEIVPRITLLSNVNENIMKERNKLLSVDEGGIDVVNRLSSIDEYIYDNDKVVDYNNELTVGKKPKMDMTMLNDEEDELKYYLSLNVCKISQGFKSYIKVYYRYKDLFKFPPWIEPKNIKDDMGRLINDNDYNPSTLWIPPLDHKWSTIYKSCHYTDCMKQWWNFKKDYFDSLLFFKMGKFYELFYHDACIIQELCPLRWMGNETKPHVGFPEKSIHIYATICIDAGYRIIVIEQTETPYELELRNKKNNINDKTVKREICEIITPGTITRPEMLGKQSRPLIILSLFNNILFIISIDVSISKLKYGYLLFNNNFNNLKTILIYLCPAEIVLDNILNNHTTIINTIKSLPFPPEITFHHANTQSNILFNRFTHIYKHTNEVTTKNGPTSVPPEVQSASPRPAESSSPPEVQSNSSSLGVEPSSNYLPVNGIATPRDRGGCEGEDGMKNSTAPQVVPVADLREAEGEINRRGTTPSGKTSSEEDSNIASCDIEITLEMYKCVIDLCESYMSSILLDRLLEYCSIECLSMESYDVMKLDGYTIMYLELFYDQNGNMMNSLFNYINRTMTSFGERLLKEWLMKPLIDIEKIKERNEVIEYLLNNYSIVESIQYELNDYPDIERGLGKIINNITNNNNKKAIYFDDDIYNKLYELYNLIIKFEKLEEIIIKFFNECDIENIKLLNELKLNYIKCNNDCNYINNMLILIDNKKCKSNNNIWNKSIEINNNINDIINKLNNILNNIRNICKSAIYINCKYRYEIELNELDFKLYKNYFNNNYQITSTKNNFIRIRNNDIINLLDQLEYYEFKLKESEEEFYQFIIRILYEKSFKFCKLIYTTSIIDCLLSITNVIKNSPNIMTKPIFYYKNNHHILKLLNCTYPLFNHQKNFIPNDIIINKNSSTIIITGPNMGGKSTLLRQVAINVILAHIGSYVNATYCELNPFDAIYTRLGATDNIVAGKSTFLNELLDISNLLIHGTENSLAIIDELGRGTSTYDGTAIALATIEKISEIGCCCIFTTHFRDVCKIASRLPNVVMYHMLARLDEDKQVVEFLYKLVEGTCPDSYGLYVAKLAGIPERVIECAKMASLRFMNKNMLNDIIKAYKHNNINALQDLYNNSLYK